MSKLISMPITKARINLGAVVEKIRTTGGSVILEKGGIPVARLSSNETVEDLQDALDLMFAREANRDTPLLNWDKIRVTYV